MTNTQRSCVKCIHYQQMPGHATGGSCLAPVPEWVFYAVEDMTRSTRVDDRTRDYAPQCELFSERTLDAKEAKP